MAASGIQAWRAVTVREGAFALPRTCGFHDHNDGENPAWMGRIVIR